MTKRCPPAAHFQCRIISIMSKNSFFIMGWLVVRVEVAPNASFVSRSTLKIFCRITSESHFNHVRTNPAICKVRWHTNLQRKKVDERRNEFSSFFLGENVSRPKPDVADLHEKFLSLTPKILTESSRRTDVYVEKYAGGLIIIYIYKLLCSHTHGFLLLRSYFPVCNN